MRRHGALISLVVALGLLVVGLAVLFRLRLAQGDVFPAYSSLRSDPLGTRALHDALAEMPGVRVDRQFKLISELEAAPARTIVMAGLPGRAWREVERDEFDALEAAVRGGSRLVIAFHAQAARTREDLQEEREAERKAKERRVRRGEREPRRIVHTDLRRRWGADVQERRMLDRGAAEAAATDEARAAGLPESIAWQSELFFELEADAGWRVLYRRATRPVLVERPLGRGSIVLAADSYFLSNEALQRDRAPSLLAWMIGPHGRVQFDEAHLGVMVDPGVAALARRYGLSGAFFTLLLLAALFVWRRMALFVPPPPEGEEEVALAYHPAAGLEALLRRSVPAAELVTACVNEWKPTARESERARVDTTVAAQPAGTRIVVRYNAAVHALKRTKDRSAETKDRRTETKDFKLKETPTGSVQGL